MFVAYISLIKWCYPINVLGLLAGSAYFFASAMMHVVAAILSVPNRALNSHFHRSDGTSVTSKVTRSANAILSRNPFDSTLGPIDTTPGSHRELVGDLDPHPIDPLAAATCRGTRLLIVSESTDPTWSVATLFASDDPRPRMRRIGDHVAGKQVAYIGYNPRSQLPTVWLVDSATICQSSLFVQPLPSVETPGSRPQTPGTAKPTQSSQTLQSVLSRITKVDAHEYRVERLALETILSEHGLLTQGVRVTPDLEDGRVVGIRLLGIREGTLGESRKGPRGLHASSIR